MNYKPVGDRIIVKPDEASDKIGSLYLPESAQRRPNEGTVVAVGDGRYSEFSQTYIPISVKVGDKIFYGEHAGLEMRMDSIDYLIMRESEIMLIKTK